MSHFPKFQRFKKAFENYVKAYVENDEVIKQGRTEPAAAAPSLPSKDWTDSFYALPIFVAIAFCAGIALGFALRFLKSRPNFSKLERMRNNGNMELGYYNQVYGNTTPTGTDTDS